ncbi:MAG TPA: GspE/PulE family protein [Phycisphaerae bacterium]|nr:GspE/PulE family protein [Phycisphaerae bacterium]
MVQLVDGLLARAISRKASDIHFEPSEGGMWVRYRLDGLLHEMDRLPAGLAENVIARLKVMAGLLTYRMDIPQEGAFQAQGHLTGGLPPIDVRVATFPTVRGERAVVRLIYTVGQVSALEDLGFSDEVVAEFRKAAEQPHGLILVTGPAGSGKSTTLYALARHILSATPGRSVVSLEDPVEQRVDGMAQIQIQPHGELDYVRAMRSLLRQDVEVLLVGEIRDAQTARVVIEAALTGHLIMSTLHSGDPAEAVVRLLEMGIEPYQIVGALSLVFSQRLVRLVCSACGGRGCESCAETGYLRRTACGQIAVMDESIRQAILDHRPVGELRGVIAADGADLAADARRLIEQGRTTVDEARRVLGSLFTCNESEKRSPVRH